MSDTPMQITAAEFKARCLSLMDTVEQDRQEVVITKRGRPVARLVPYEEKLPSVFGCMAGTIEILGDIIEPVAESWDADSE